MRCSCETARPVGQENGQAVCHHDTAGDASLRGVAGIGFYVVRSVNCQAHNAGAVNLREQNWLGNQSLLQD